MKLKESTKKLLQLLSDIETKTFSITPNYNTSTYIPPLHHVEEQEDYVEHCCTIYRRLTGKCHCLNKYIYNDFTIQFDENTKFKATAMGDIIKNLRVIKKFLYIGGNYSKHALTFLNEGLTESSYGEKIDIVQGCAYVDICNIFEEHSIVLYCITWPCKSTYGQDYELQLLAAKFIKMLSDMEEGKKYLDLTSKIGYDIKKTINKRGSKLEYDTLQMLTAALETLIPPEILINNAFTNVYYFNHLNKERMGRHIINVLNNNLDMMTLNEVLSHLKLLRKMSHDEGRHELEPLLPPMLNIFKNLMQYNNNDINDLILDVLDNFVLKCSMKQNKMEEPHISQNSETNHYNLTLPGTNNSVKKEIERHESHVKKKYNKSRQRLNKKNHSKQVLHGNKYRSKSKMKDLNKSIIVVPLE